MLKRRIMFSGGGPKDGLALDVEFPDQLAAETMLANGLSQCRSDNPEMSHYYAAISAKAVEPTETDPVTEEPEICWVYTYEGEFPSSKDQQETE